MRGVNKAGIANYPSKERGAGNSAAQRSDPFS